MEIVYPLIGVSCLFLVVVGLVFWWAVDDGQFEDLERAGAEILREDDESAVDTTQ
jgi:cbb3-type cytochrome oxidase maturation protein